MPKKVLVSDTNIWIDLDRGGLLGEVFSLPYQFVTTDFVWEELHQPSGEKLDKLGLKVEALTRQEIENLFALKTELNNSSLADVSCYFIAKTRGWILLTNDGAVRKAGMARNLEVHGVLWLMDELYDRKLVSGKILTRALAAMLDSDARLPKHECDKREKCWSQ